MNLLPTDSLYSLDITLKYDKAIIMSLSIQSPQDAVMWLYSFLAYQI